MRNKIIIGVLFGVVFCLGIVIGLLIPTKENEKKETNTTKQTTTSSEKIENVIKYVIRGVDYYIIDGEYKGEYDYQEKEFAEEFKDYNKSKSELTAFNSQNILSYQEYVDYCDKWKLNKKYTDENKKYFVIAYVEYGRPIVEAKLANVITKDNKAKVYMLETISGVTADISGYALIIPLDNNISDKEIVLLNTKQEYEYLKEYGVPYNPGELSVDKPIIYIYPEEETNVKVKLGHSELLTVSYPKYNKEWNVIAKPNGDLQEVGSSRTYYGLYYEGSNHNNTIKEDGFVVKGEDTTKFLEEKLEYLGLNEREINEFIIYWLPRLESNKYNYIRFETKEEIEEYMPLEITPTPDSVIRVIMDYKPLDEEISVKEQKLEKSSRTGYTVVEWGGSEIK